MHTFCKVVQISKESASFTGANVTTIKTCKIQAFSEGSEIVAPRYIYNIAHPAANTIIGFALFMRILNFKFAEKVIYSRLAVANLR